MSEINQVLANSLSPDAASRHSAEQALTQAAETNFPLYLVTLVQELANEATEGPIRAAAGIALKNAFTARDPARQTELRSKWLEQTDDETKNRIRSLTLETLGSSSLQAGHAAAQVVSSIAIIELPKNLWSDLLPSLVKNVNESDNLRKQASLTTIGYICECPDQDLRAALAQHSNAILTAVVQGARKEEPDAGVRLAAITALHDSLDCIKNNFQHEGERNYIMQVVCEATQASDNRVQQGAFGCLNRIMFYYYENMRFYMEKALFGLTILGMKSEDEDVAKLAVEFWSTVCEKEIEIEEENAHVETSEQLLPFFNFARVAANEVVPVLLLLLTKQDEDATDDEYNISRAAYQCLLLYSKVIGNAIVQPILDFATTNMPSEEWHLRDAAVTALGALTEGPDEATLTPIVTNALGHLIGLVEDPHLSVRDSAAYTLGCITAKCPSAINPEAHAEPLLKALFSGLISNAKLVPSCCWALMNLAEQFAGNPGDSENLLTPHFASGVEKLLELSTQYAGDSTARTAIYEVINTFVHTAALTSFPVVAHLSDAIIHRLEESINMQGQVVSVDDKINLSDMQSSLCSVLQAIVQKLDTEIAPQADRIMSVLLQILSSVGSKSSVPEAVFGVVSAVATAVNEDFIKYMEAFGPYLGAALGNQEELALCSLAIGLVSDITRSLGRGSQPFCDQFMTYLLTNLRSETLSNKLKPGILQCFGDIASAIEGDFESYLSVVAQVLQQAAQLEVTNDSDYEMVEYVVELREGIMDAWGGIIPAMHYSGKTHLLQVYVPSIFVLLNSIAVNESYRTDALMRSSMGVIGDLTEAFPNRELAEALRQGWVTAFIKEARNAQEYLPRTVETARWARELVKKQLAQ